LNPIGIVQEIILRIQVKVDDVIAQGGHIRFVAGSRIAVGEGRPHVRGEETLDIVERNLVVVHLVQALRSGEHILPLDGSISAEVLVAPSMRTDLVASSVHTLDDRGIA
jgi:hypothetical protein